jgi:CHAD domain-containing protein
MRHETSQDRTKRKPAHAGSSPARGHAGTVSRAREEGQTFIKGEAYRDKALQILNELDPGKPDPEVLHDLRVALRRLQAYLDLIGESSNAAGIAEMVSRLSPLRTLHVLDEYLNKRRVEPDDRRKVGARIAKTLRKLDGKDVFRKLERRLRRYGAALTPPDLDTMRVRLRAAGAAHYGELHALITAASATPKRKALHALRLKLKTIRYQYEIAVGTGELRDGVLPALMRAQRILGAYEERAQFRKLARKLDLGCCALINKDLKRARRRARSIPHDLLPVLEILGDRRVRALPVS